MANEALKKLRDKLKSLKQQARVETVKYLTEKAEGVEQLNREQLAFGIYTDESAIQQGYSEVWGEERSEKGLQTEFVDLKFEGDFYKSITIDPTLNHVEFSADDSKTDEILKMFPGGVLGLTQKNADRLGREIARGITPKLINWIK